MLSASLNKKILSLSYSSPQKYAQLCIYTCPFFFFFFSSPKHESNQSLNKRSTSPGRKHRTAVAMEREDLVIEVIVFYLFVFVVLT